jgi:LysM repeat protein
MSLEPPSKTSKLCPVCGTRLTEDAVRCLVCGADLSASNSTAQNAKTIQGSRMPTLTLSLPLVIGLLALFLAIGATLVYFALRSTPEVILEITSTPTVTLTTTPTITGTPPPPTPTDTPAPSPTPATYTIQAGDNCIGIAAFFEVSVQSIVTLNNLSATCDNLVPGNSLLIPQPTPTATSLPSATLSLGEQTEAACEKIEYVVQENDTLSSISINYGIPMEAIRTENGLPSDTVLLGQTLIIPLCQRFATPGPSPTPTPPPPYAAPNLLLPADGAPFTLANDTVTLQWASVGTLRENEAYEVIVEDVTGGEGDKLVSYVTDSKFIAPAALRPADTTPHVFRWSVRVARQTGADDSGNPLWEPAGESSTPRVFTWSSLGGAPTPTP